MSDEELHFLNLMKECEKIQEEYRLFYAYITKAQQNHEALLWNKQHRGSRELEKKLIEAGRSLGYLPRFQIDPRDGELHIIPKNGAGERMMNRYEELFIQRELSYET